MNEPFVGLIGLVSRGVDTPRPSRQILQGVWKSEVNKWSPWARCKVYWERNIRKLKHL